MKKINAMIIAVIAASLILVAGCYDGGAPMPPVDGYDGLVAAGWEAFEAADYISAMENFQAAIDMDVSRPDAYLGAGWTSVLIPDYWGLGEQYDYMAYQLDGGTWPVEFNTATVEQDLSWSEFVCIDPALTANDSLVINSWGTTDTLIIDDTLVVFEPDSLKPAMDNVEIGEWLYSQYGAVRFQYTFEIDNPNVEALFAVANGFSLADASVDSIVNGASSSTVYLSVPYVRIKLGDVWHRTWCMYEDEMTFEYATYSSPAEQLAFGTDAMAAYGILQNARGVNGDEYMGVAALLGLAEEGEYSFSHYAGLTSVKLKGMAAAMAYANLHFRPALGICQQAGYGLDIEVADPNFLVELMQVIETMLQ
ncbi:MAG: hypothetical protein B1H09_02640 [Gemmatimonadaceae bacterium 4484_173]|nr:MAG: hypothetical protein B1H09_02640 [Gemmatimonadaceae bacterium 4484_173]RKZ05050.1 MAG: hypothetical protein DRQ21_00820 [Candidatus Fermentibacteria bacterium]